MFVTQLGLVTTLLESDILDTFLTSLRICKGDLQVLQNRLHISANFAQNATLRVFTLSDSPMKGKFYSIYITLHYLADRLW
jgi:hypothetical protein